MGNTEDVENASPEKAQPSACSTCKSNPNKELQHEIQTQRIINLVNLQNASLPHVKKEIQAKISQAERWLDYLMDLKDPDSPTNEPDLNHRITRIQDNIRKNQWGNAIAWTHDLMGLLIQRQDHNLKGKKDEG
jgi:hypothetical protein